MYLPTVTDERTNAVEYLRTQLAAVRAASYGLSDSQARERPLRSELSLAGLLRHCCFCMAGSLHGAGKELPHVGPADIDPTDFYGSFTVPDGADLEDVLATFDALTESYLDMVAGLDFDQEMPVGPMPWYGLDEARPASMRYLVVHHIEEFARHAGHADLIREQIDGAKAAELNATIEGRPANDFVTPWQPSQP